MHESYEFFSLIGSHKLINSLEMVSNHAGQDINELSKIRKLIERSFNKLKSKGLKILIIIYLMHLSLNNIKEIKLSDIVS